MADSMFLKGLGGWLAGFLALALVVGGAVGLAALTDDRSPPPMDDLRVSNHDDERHRVHVRVAPANGSETIFSETVGTDPAERVSWQNATAPGREYRLTVTVDDRAAESFAVEGPDDLCTTEVRIEENGTVETATSCA